MQCGPGVHARAALAVCAHHLLVGYTGTIMRDGYTGHEYLTGAVHAWCGAHA